MRRSDTGSNSAWTTYGLMTGVTWKRPSSKMRAENPVLWCEPRIFWTRIRRWISTSEIGCILSSMIPSARYASSRRGCGASSPRHDASDAASASTRVGGVCSRETYKPFASRCRAFACRIAYVKVDFIVPGKPDTSTTCPTGKPPPRTSSRPSMNVGIFFVPMELPPSSFGQCDATRPSEPVEFPVEIGIEPEPEHLGQGEPPDAVDRVALVVPHRAHAAVRTEVPDLRMDSVLVTRERRVRRREEPALVDRFRVRLARLFRVRGRLELREVDQDELPEAFFFDRAQEWRGGPGG